MLMRFSLMLVMVILAACSKPIPTLEGVDLTKWKDDKNACSGDRQSMAIAVKTESQKLKGLSEMDVVDLLGRPDENELYKRNQKFFYYYITAGPDCPEHGTIPSKLIIRFNAMGYAQLVSVGSAGQ